MPGFSVLMRSLLLLEKNMKPDSAFLGALGSFFLRGLRAFLPSPTAGGGDVVVVVKSFPQQAEEASKAR